MKFCASLFFFFLCYAAFLAQDNNRIVAIGDSLVGKLINGESIRELHGNVVMTQGAVSITCDKAIQYLAKNEAELIGNVVVTQDSIVIKTIRGYYFGNSNIAFSKNGIDLSDGHVQLYSKTGYYYFDEKRSYFYDQVNLKEGVSNLSALRLNYFDDEDKVIAGGNVIVSDTSSTMLADSLIYFRNTKNTFAFNNIRLYNYKDRIAIFGERLEDVGQNKYSKIWGNPFFARIDTASDGQLDTLMVSSMLMEAFDDSVQKMVATDSVKILKTGFASSNHQTFFFSANNEIRTFKKEGDELPPVIWNDETQLSGDSVYVFIKDNRLTRINLNSNAVIISEHKDKPFRFDQISGKAVKIFFENGEINLTDVTGNVLSIYYLYDEDEPNGLVKSSSQSAKIYFENGEVKDVRLYGKPATEFHPENLLEGKEKEFTIPSFKIFTNKPTKEQLLSRNNKVLYYLTKDSAYYAEKFNLKGRKP
ncbi:MAG: OstA family protein [Ignavibacteria bacterium]|nr:MAG: OstA family protein [Ignavibacteria bacterium]KAF0159860.1 MAG: OstA family protein [Ignavibacteria bacterium]